jgi:hypothetical protein
LIKATILDQILVDWFTQSLLAPISRDVAMGGVVNEEKIINHVMSLDLVYFQCDTFYELIPHAPCPSNDLSRLTLESHVDAMVASIKLQSVTQSNGQQDHLASIPTSSHTSTTKKSTSSPAQTSEVNAVQ